MLEPKTARGRHTVYVALWALATACFGLAVTGTAVFGLDRASLLLLATVFAAVTEEYRGKSSCNAGSST